MWVPNQEKVKALMGHLASEIERIVHEKLFGDAADVAPGLKTVGATVVVAAAVQYARKSGMPRDAVVNIADMTYRASELADSFSVNTPPPKPDDA